MPWLVSDDRVFASVEVAETSALRRRGLPRRDAIDGALFLQPANSAHTIGIRFAIDDESTVLRIVPMHPGRPARGARAVVEAEAGLFQRSRLSVGDHVEVRR